VVEADINQYISIVVGNAQPGPRCEVEEPGRGLADEEDKAAGTAAGFGARKGGRGRPRSRTLAAAIAIDHRSRPGSWTWNQVCSDGSMPTGRRSEQEGKGHRQK